jgi:phosphoenolpyruvate synthase/pyruvate phosphate dikinase
MITRNSKLQMLEAELNMYKKRKFTCSKCNHQEELHEIPNIFIPNSIPIKAHEFLKNIHIEIPSNHLMSRDEFIGHFHDYINSNNLKTVPGSEYPRNMCIIDKNIRKLFSLSDITILTYGEFNKQIYKLFYVKN